MFFLKPFALVACIIGCFAYDDNPCGLPLKFESQILGIAYRNHEIEDTSTENEFFKFDIPSNIERYSFDYYNPRLDVLSVEVFENKTVIVRPTKNFRKVDDLISSQEASIYEVEIGMSFFCEDYQRTKFDFIQPIKDTNNHQPRFNRKTYKYRFGMPLKQGARLTELMEIFAIDMDFSNTEINFSIAENDYIEIASRENGYHPDKLYFADLITKKELPIGWKGSFEITAKDIGKPEQMTTAMVTIKIDE